MNELKKKSFWAKPEGTAGMIFLALAGLVGLWAASLLMPIIVALLANTLMAVVMGGALLGIIAVIMNPNFRKFGRFLFEKAMRALANLFTNVYPLDVLQSLLAEWKRKLVRVKEGLASVRAELARIIGELNQNGEQINQLKAEFRLANKRADEAKLKKDGSAYREQTAIKRSRAQMVRMATEQRKAYQTLYEQTRKSYNSLERIYHVLRYKVEVEEFNFETKRAQWDNARQNRSIVRDASSILRGINDSELYDQANRRIEEEMYLAEAEIEMLDEFTLDLQRSLEARDFLEVERLTNEIERAASKVGPGEDFDFDEIEMIPDVDTATNDIPMLEDEVLEYSNVVEEEEAYA